LAIEGLRRRTDRRTTGGLGNIARAFAHRNYLVYVSGNSISLIGWWLERVAVGWLTWTLTHSGAWLGLISLADFLPVLFLAPFAGVLAATGSGQSVSLSGSAVCRQACWRFWSSVTR
jgi:hypothetical protein